MKTGQVAKEAGVNVETLRFYERRGILKEPKRRASGYREYPPETVQIVRFVKRAQELGFTLDEVEELLVLRDDSARSCDEVRQVATVKIGEIESKIRELTSMKEALSVLVASCGDGTPERECPILDALDDKEERREQ